MEIKCYKVPVVWGMMGYIPVSADVGSPEDAKQYVKEHADEYPLPNGEYLEDSFEVDEEGDPIPIRKGQLLPASKVSKQIYTLFTCDDWKTRDSMSLLMVTTSVRKLKSFIVRKIADETFVYDNDGFSSSAQVELFESDFESGLIYGNLSVINDRLLYGFLDQHDDGEEI